MLDEPLAELAHLRPGQESIPTHCGLNASSFPGCRALAPDGGRSPSYVQACRGAKDHRFLDVAIDDKAWAIITGERVRLALCPFHGVRKDTVAGIVGEG